MKKFKLSILTLLMVFVASSVFISCETESDLEIKEGVAFENKIGFIDIETNNFVEINKSQIVKYWKHNFEIDAKIKFNDFRVIKGKYSDTEEKYYLLKTISDNGRISIANILTIDKVNNALILGTKTCKCESTTCTWSGCEASMTSNRCSCSSCQGDCKKTSTVTNGYASADYGIYPNP